MPLSTIIRGPQRALSAPSSPEADKLACIRVKEDAIASPTVRGDQRD